MCGRTWTWMFEFPSRPLSSCCSRWGSPLREAPSPPTRYTFAKSVRRMSTGQAQTSLCTILCRPTNSLPHRRPSKRPSHARVLQSPSICTCEYWAKRSVNSRGSCNTSSETHLEGKSWGNSAASWGWGLGWLRGLDESGCSLAVESCSHGDEVEWDLSPPDNPIMDTLSVDFLPVLCSEWAASIWQKSDVSSGFTAAALSI